MAHSRQPARRPWARWTRPRQSRLPCTGRSSVLAACVLAECTRTRTHMHAGSFLPDRWAVHAPTAACWQCGAPEQGLRPAGDSADSAGREALPRQGSSRPAQRLGRHASGQASAQRQPRLRSRPCRVGPFQARCTTSSRGPRIWHLGQTLPGASQQRDRAWRARPAGKT